MYVGRQLNWRFMELTTARGKRLDRPRCKRAADSFEDINQV